MITPIDPEKLDHLPKWAQRVMESKQATIERLMRDNQKLKGAVKLALTNNHFDQQLARNVLRDIPEDKET